MNQVRGGSILGIVLHGGTSWVPLETRGQSTVCIQDGLLISKGAWPKLFCGEHENKDFKYNFYVFCFFVFKILYVFLKRKKKYGWLSIFGLLTR